MTAPTAPLPIGSGPATADGAGRTAERLAPSRLLQAVLEAAARPVPTKHRSKTTGLPSSPTTPRRALVLGLAGLTTATEAASVAGWLPDLRVADLDISIALLPALVLAVACGPRLLGRSTAPRVAAAFWVTVAVALPVLGWQLWRIDRFGWFPGVVAAALGEELIYRLAIPAVIAAALRIVRVPVHGARIAGLVGAGLWFVLLPGHVEQMTGTTGALPFVAFAALAAIVVLRSGSILPMALAHATLNLLTILSWQEVISPTVRSAAVGVVLLLLAIAYGRTSRITVGDDGDLVDTRTGLAVSVIDLRDGQPATVELADGRVIPVHANIVRPEHVGVRHLDLPDPVPDDLREFAKAARSAARARSGWTPPSFHHELDL